MRPIADQPCNARERQQPASPPAAARCLQALGVMKPVSALIKIAGALLGLEVLAIAALSLVHPEMCDNKVISESRSPDGVKRIVVFERDCGATSSSSTQVSLLPADTPLPNKAGNLLVADTDHGAAPAGPGGGPSVSVIWGGPQYVLLTYHPKARVFKAEKELDGVTVRHDTAP